MSQKAIRAALETELNTWAIANTFAVAFENRAYTPMTGTKYVRVFLLPAETQNPSLGTDHKRKTGIMQASLYMPFGTGPGTGETLADSLAATFERGTSFTASGVTVRILDDPSIAPALPGDGWYAIPVSIRYQADILS